MDRPSVLTIGGFDPLGTAGVTADRNTLLALGCQAVSIVSGVILGAAETVSMDPAVLEAQLRTFINVGGFSAVKVGLLTKRSAIEVAATFFEDLKPRASNLIIDVSLFASGGAALMANSAVSMLKIRLMPLAVLVIAHLDEASRLAGFPVETITQMKEAAEAIRIFGPKYVLVKADRVVEDELVDILYDGREHQFLFTKKIPSALPDFRLKRDIFAAAVAAYLVRGYSLFDALAAAKKYELGEAK